MMNLKNIIVVIILAALALPAAAFAKNPKSYIRKGNDLYEKKKFEDAEVEFMKSLEESREHYQGVFNLGDALYKQEKYEEAADNFLEITTKNLDDKTIAKAYHNLGNSYLKAKKIDKSIKAYKEALKRNPRDNETRYNLEYAKRLKKRQQQQKNKNQNKQNKDQQKQNKDQQKKNKQDQQKQNKQQQEQNQQQQQQKQNKDQQKKNMEQRQAEKKQGKKGEKGDKDKKKISKKDAVRILKALSREEQQVQKKLKKQKSEDKKLEKNW